MDDIKMKAWINRGRVVWNPDGEKKKTPPGLGNFRGPATVWKCMLYDNCYDGWSYDGLWMVLE